MITDKLICPNCGTAVTFSEIETKVSCESCGLRIQVSIHKNDVPWELPKDWGSEKEDVFQDWLAGGGPKGFIDEHGGSPTIDVDRDGVKLRCMFDEMMKVGEAALFLERFIENVIASTPDAVVRLAVCYCPPPNYKAPYAVPLEEHGKDANEFIIGAFALLKDGSAQLFPINDKRDSVEGQMTEHVARVFYQKHSSQKGASGSATSHVDVDLRQEAEKALRKAAWQLEQRVKADPTDTIDPLYILLDGSGEWVCGELHWRDDQEKSAAGRGLSVLAQSVQAVAVVTIFDGYTSHDPKAMRPRDDPERGEALSAAVVTPDGNVSLFLSRQYRREGRTIHWQEEVAESRGSAQLLIPAWC
jgi:hypothetical protein